MSEKKQTIRPLLPAFEQERQGKEYIGQLNAYIDFLEAENQRLKDGIKFIDTKLGKNQWPAKRKIKELLNTQNNEDKQS